VDDKIIRRGRELRIDAPELARMYEHACPDFMRARRHQCAQLDRNCRDRSSLARFDDQLAAANFCAIAHALSIPAYV
jgi:hypothetical protein